MHLPLRPAQTGALLAGVEGAEALGGLAPWQRSLLGELKLEGPGANTEVTILQGAQPVDGRLLAAARILWAREQSELAGRGLARLQEWGKPLSKANEGRALKTLTGVAAIALSQFSTTLEQDAKALQDGVMPVPEPAAAVASTSTSGASAETAAAAAAGKPQPLSEDMRRAIEFRVGKKRLLRAALQALNLRIGEVAGAAGIRDHAGGGGRKGEAPRAASPKGFGAQPSGAQQTGSSSGDRLK